MVRNYLGRMRKSQFFKKSGRLFHHISDKAPPSARSSIYANAAMFTLENVNSIGI